jgi:anti-sigma regulatory factor (Ser/Thr protein kinase)
MDIKSFICENIYQRNTEGLSKLVAKQFGITRQAAQKHIRQLVTSGVLTMVGATKAAKYSFVNIATETKSFPLTPDMSEDLPWRTIVRPLLDNLPENIISICQYGFTEMLNNAIDHSEGTSVTISVERTAYNIVLYVKDNGIGIFRKITRDFNLDDERHAILELSKGKLTSDPSRHSGEGVFFTSRMFDRFIIMSDKLFFSHSLEHDDWLLEHELVQKGTNIVMDIRISSTRTTRGVFNEYATIDHPGFYKTHIPLSLAQYGDENLISRSQAKRVMARVEKFTEVVLDFKGVSEIGQAFADEIFRIYSKAHPQIHIFYVNANESVEWMIKRAQLPSEPFLPGLF